MLALLSALIVAAFDRRWLCGPVSGLLPEEGLSLERLSRLKARVLAPMEGLVSDATRRGRPPRQPEPTDESLLLRELLLLVPRETWTYLSRKRRAALVTAQDRLQGEHRLPAKRFCALLNISDRTFRSWKAKAATQTPPRSAEAVSKPPPPRRPEDKNPGRFDLEVTAPGIQAMGDTTDWELFGVPLKIVAVQDPGNRKQKLWESFAVDSTENAELVVKVAGEALRETPGMQFISDQGTPYMAQATAQALKSMEIDHTPQREGTPTAKATKERAFGVVKQALRPLVDVSRCVAEKVPALRRPDLARALGRILLAVYLRVYEAAPREGGHPLEREHAETLRVIIEEQRENARAEEKSKRLLLTTMHNAYDLCGSRDRFIRAHRHFSLEDIQEAETYFRERAAKPWWGEIKNYQAYFGAVLRNVSAKNRKQRAEERRCKLTRAQEAKEQQALAAKAQRLKDHPELHLQEGLDLVAAQWQPKDRVLLFQGRGPGGRFILEALQSLREHDSYNVTDRAEAAWRTWISARPDDSVMLAAVRTVFDRKLTEFVTPAPTTGELVSGRMNLNAKPKNRPLTQQADLRNCAAGTWG
jgi:transposase InsO family protein